MKYMLLMVGVHADDDPAETAAPNPPASSAADPDEPCWMPWYREMTARGAHLLQGDRLQPASLTPELLGYVSGCDNADR